MDSGSGCLRRPSAISSSPSTRHTLVSPVPVLQRLPSKIDVPAVVAPSKSIGSGWREAAAAASLAPGLSASRRAGRAWRRLCERASRISRVPPARADDLANIRAPFLPPPFVRRRARLPLPGLRRLQHGVGDAVGGEAVAKRRRRRPALAEPLQEIGELMDERVLVPRSADPAPTSASCRDGRCR